MGTWVVTGANRGIGLELCRQLAAKGEDVIAACRVSSKDLDAIRGITIVANVDVTTEAGVAAMTKATEGKTLDVVLHNAGILVPDSLDALDFDAMRRQLEVNALGPLRLTQALLPRLKKGSKLAFVSSRVGSLADNGSGGMYGYRMSKTALNMAARSLSRDLAGRGIHVVILHPGFIRTDLTGGAGNDDPATAATGLLARIAELDATKSGTFWHANGERLPW